MSQSLEAERWDAQYELGRYTGEPPVPFVSEIMSDLGQDGKNLLGLYVGCGNGRNYIPLLKSGLNIRGIDISGVGIKQLLAHCPEAEGLVRVESFDKLAIARVFDYLVAIQVFQHGNQATAHDNFRIARDVLKPGGRLFLRVNSTSTQIKHQHAMTEQNEQGSYTVRYHEGPKSDTEIHFFSHEELMNLAVLNNFEIITPLFDRMESRHEHADGHWAQWETIWQKR